jgi:hypothetical protein
MCGFVNNSLAIVFECSIYKALKHSSCTAHTLSLTHVPCNRKGVSEGTHRDKGQEEAFAALGRKLAQKLFRELTEGRFQNKFCYVHETALERLNA